MKPSHIFTVALGLSGCLGDPPPRNNDAKNTPLSECSSWEVRWDDDAADASVLETTGTLVAKVGPASASDAYIVGGTRGTNEQPISYSRIFRSQDGQPFELLVEEAELRELEAVRCVEGDCWYGGSQEQIGVVRNGEKIAATHDAARGFAIREMSSAADLVAGFSHNGIFLTSESFPDTFGFIPYEDGVQGYWGGCNPEECVAAVVRRAEDDTYSLSFMRVDAESREMTEIVPAGLPECARGDCDIQQAAATNWGWFIAFKNGPLYLSNDDGATWAPYEGTLGSPRSTWRKLDFHGSTGAVMTETELLFSVNGGESFHDVPAMEILRDIAFTDDRSGMGLSEASARRFEIVCLD